MASLAPVVRSLVLSTLALAVLLTSCSSGAQVAGIGVAEGTNIARIAIADRELAPTIVGEALQGDPITAELVAGKVSVINFWGSWCGPCRREEPILEEVWARMGPEGVAFVGVNTRRDQRAAAVAFLEEFGVTYPSVYDPDSTIAYSFRVRVMPATFILDAQGRIAAQIVGAVRSAAELEALLREVGA